MMMTLRGSERDAQQNRFNALFRLRYEMFVVRRQWALPTRGRLDIDEYDTPEAVYFFDVGSGGDVISHVRMNPTSTQSLLADYFPHLCERDVAIRGDTIWESTRYFVEPARKTRSSQNATRARLMCEMLHWARARGVTHIQAVIEASMLPHFVAMTDETIPLGLAHPYGGGPDVPGGGTCMAIRWPVTPKTINDIEQFGGLSEVTARQRQLVN